MDRRDFVRTSAAGLAAAAATPHDLTGEPRPSAPALHVRSAVKPVVVSDVSGIRYRNGGAESSVERAFRGIIEGEDVHLHGQVVGAR